MDFFFTDEQKDLRKMLVDFVDREIAPQAAHYDETGEFPWENVKKIASLGLFGVKMPVEYGGMGEGMVTACIIIEELGRGCASTAGTFLIHTGAASDSINMFGSEEQKRRYLPALARGERIAAFALSEPEAGSDPGGMLSTARREGDYYVLNGSKCWTTNGIEAEVYVVGAKTRPELREKGISSFIVEKGTPGFTFGKKERKMGMNASATGTEYFDSCRLPKENLLGKENDGYRQALIALNKERVGNASICMGIARAALDHAISYAKSRKAFEETIASFQGIRFMIAEMATQLRAARWLVYSAAKRIDMQLPSVAEVSMAKLFANEMAMRVTNDALQIHGAYGYTKEYPLERYMRDARGLAIGGGTTQIQRAIIASQFLD